MTYRKNQLAAQHFLNLNRFGSLVSLWRHYRGQLSHATPSLSRSPLLPGTTRTSFTPVEQSVPLLRVGKSDSAQRAWG